MSTRTPIRIGSSHRLSRPLAWLLLPLTAACSEGSVPTAPENAASLVSSDAFLPTTTERFLNLSVGPVAIAHRGMGVNLGEDPTRPIENTLEAVRAGYEAGASVVELDLQMTADGEIVTWHDDFLEGGICINSLSRQELRDLAPHIPSFKAVLQIARRYNLTWRDRLTGLLTVDLKPASPRCDPSDVSGPTFVSTVVATIRQMKASDLVYFNSMSPVLLGLAADEAPEIPRQLTVLLLQLLSPEQVEDALGLQVVEVEKQPSYGLTWAEIGDVFRLPGYASPQQAIATAIATASRIVSYDLLLLGHIERTQPGAAAHLVQSTQALGLHVFGGDVSVADQWFFGAALGLEALYADDVPLAVSLQPAID